MTETAFPFSDAEVDALDERLFDSRFPDALDLFAIHGMICAIGIHQPPSATEHALTELILGDGNWDAETGMLLEKHLTQLKRHIQRQLSQETGLVLPSEVYEDDDALISWCSGFMEGVFCDESAWFDSTYQENVANLMLPIMAHSGLYEEEEDYQEISGNDKLMAQLVEQIPETVQDLYLLFNAED